MEKTLQLLFQETKRVGRFDIVLQKRSTDVGICPYSYISTHCSVCVLPFVGEDVLLEYQYRYSTESWEYEIPGGVVEMDEQPVATAVRELLEETGYIADGLINLGFFYPSPGSSNEKTWLFAGACIRVREPAREPLEQIQLETVTTERLQQLIDDGTIHHSMTIVAWSRYQAYLRRKNQC